MSEPTESRRTYDVVVIGGGAAGLVTAAGSARLGARVALIERDRLGGECLWTGCVPSKALLRSAEIAQSWRHGDRFGLRPGEPELAFREVMQSMRAVIARIQPHDDPERFRDMGVDVIQGTAKLARPGHVEVDGRDLETRHIVIATGSRPIVPPIEGLAEVGYLTHETILELETRPERLVVLGAGPIGLEFAQVFNRLGAEVTVVELTERILPKEDPELTEELQELLEAEGIRFRLGHRAVGAERRNGERSLRIQGPDGSETRIHGDEILMATGMRPYTSDLGLENVGVELDDGGAVRVDDRLRTTARRIWAAGDVTGVLFFTHVADYQARLLVRNLFFPFHSRADYSAIPWATYTDPTLARVGPTESEARARHGDGIGVYRARFDDLDRAITDRAPHGRVKLITDSRGRLLAGHVLGPHADSLVHEIVVALRSGTKIGSLSQTVHAYPTLSEAIRRAADSYYAEKLESTWVGRVLRWWVGRER